ncbi:DUF5606 domain-containing protein [Elizabethkingia meningoseptica]|uniref:Uncharacterized protein n=1 Tax=Elizabethkingia meningoseptica TaxID=238 RepID=A0A1T3F489_ELIME|nr:MULTISPECIES: DUF5606 domain-containing protein [Elizabethkingia]AQX03729.1 hypothetical protein BBD33_00015 [Elizabethkingia meningoseptica]AQX11176.1 hypothetical protein BBD35_01735 [Elizabethkingia meningoseptica]AQX45768.1 hypothetical protein B5G46_00015 [Elizabethkingia meningoseptica]EJK5329926.1 DUF5606 domain-containing protein [Elizabethkingia meningoseptica]EOR29820.1 hypothetical protein L100_09244 [Elizabethkingia meningoseptica ATCC 13253 = NBRC 12535]
MQLERIISISGKPGLFRLVSQLRTGFIVEDITTGKKANISNTSQVSLLDNISMFTFDSEVPLFEVFHNIAKKEDFQATINHKSSGEELKALMAEVLPNYDVERVYESDIKKLTQWYNTLHKAGYIKPESFVAPVAEEAEAPAEVAEEVKEKKAPAKKTAKAKEEKAEEEKPAKKTAKKKTEE